MTTEQMDEKDGLTYRGRDVALPVTLWGEPVLEDLKTAIDQAGDRGVLILPSQGIEAEEFWVDIGRNGEPVEAGLKPGTDYHVRVNGGDETVQTTMAAEEPARRDRRNWLDGFLDGYRQGFERGEWR